MIALLLTACNSGKPVTKHGDREDNGEVAEHRDQWHPNEAQSDFLDIGKQAGIEWLSFVQQDQQEYPEYFEGLDRDQKRRVRLAPKESDERVLLQFDLPEGSKLWPVDWYGTELMAVDLPNARGISVALAAMPESADARASRETAESLFLERAGRPPSLDVPLSQKNGVDLVGVAGNNYVYGGVVLAGRTGKWVMIAEADGGQGRRVTAAQAEGIVAILSGVSIKRELALEGSPKHKCSSTLIEQLGGTLRFPDGVLKLPIESGYLVRKIGGDSTIQIDGEGAEPWILIRRMKQPEGDIRAAIRRETTFNRRIKVISAKFSSGYTPQESTLPMVAWEYGDSGAENELLGIMKAGDELLVFEVVSTGLRDGDKRRAAKEAALKLLAGATAEPATEAPEFERLVGWNAGE